MNSKRKGNAGELELLHLLEAHGLQPQRNEQRYIVGVDNPDIGLSVKGQRYHIEVKRTERFNLYAALEQAEHDAAGHAQPVVIHRRNKKPWVAIIPLNDLLRLTEKPSAAPHEREVNP